MFKTSSLTPEVKAIIINKATEYPEYVCNTDLKLGSYLCRNCGVKLFEVEDKFDSGTGWPSFDKPYADHVLEVPDADGKRTEIICNNCGGHLGHVFHNEQFTERNTRYCVNSKALDFVEDAKAIFTDEIIVAAGCFWGVEYHFQKLAGVVKTEVGYIGGNSDNPTYEQICMGNSGHYEAIRILFDKQLIDAEKILKHFFEIHDFTQKDGQGNDIGTQYLSRIFYYNEYQKLVALKLIKELENKNEQVATKILPMQIFWPAEEYHQKYYRNNGSFPYCHFWQQIF